LTCQAHDHSLTAIYRDGISDLEGVFVHQRRLLRDKGFLATFFRFLGLRVIPE
jgi:hypothetical protein